MNSGNIRIPYEKPAIIYFEWDTTFRYHLEDLSNYEIRKQVFKNTYEQNKNHFFINHPNKFGIYSNKGFKVKGSGRKHCFLKNFGAKSWSSIGHFFFNSIIEWFGGATYGHSWASARMVE